MRKQLSFYLKKGSLRRRIILLIFLLLIFVSANVFLIYFKNPQDNYTNFVKRVAPFPAIIIGNKIITVGSYEKELAIERKIQETAYKISFDSSADGQALLKKLKDSTEEKMIEYFLMEKMLSNAGLAVSDNEVAKEYNALLENAGGEISTKNILKFFAGLTIAETKSKIYKYLLEEKTKDRFLSKAKISSINVLVSDANNQGQWAEAESKIKLIESNIKGGAGFDSAKRSFGAMGAGDEDYYVADLSENIRAGIANIKVGEVSGIIRGEDGYYLVRVIERKGGYDGSLTDFMTEKKQGIRIWRLMP